MRKQKAQLTLHGRCTTCRKQFTCTEAQLREARDIGCLFSPCCSAVATVSKATIRRLPVTL